MTPTTEHNQGVSPNGRSLDVVIASYRAKHFLHRCLDSIRAHPPTVPVTVRVIDNASGDGIAEMVRTDFSEVEFTTVGKKGLGTLTFRGMTIDRSFQGFSVEPTYADAEQVTEHLVSRFTAEEVNRVVIVYNAFASVLEQRVTTEQLLPVERTVVLDADDDGEEDEAPEAGRGLALFEPEPEDFLKALLPTFLDTTIYRALLESAAAELAARRAAMHNATDNAGELIDDLTLAMNRARQAAITQEILEVVAGADALQ